MSGKKSDHVDAMALANILRTDAQQSQEVAALYLDNGTSNYNVQNNVVGGYSPYWLIVTTTVPPRAIATNNTVQNNYVATTAGGIAQGGNTGSTNTVNNNTTVNLTTTPWPSAAQTDIAGAGLETAYDDIVPDAGQSNLAYQTPVTVSSTYSGNPGTSGNDGSATSMWASAVGDSGPYWQTDLGTSDGLSKVELLFRQDQN